jgi:hypothetical protein
MTSDGQFAIRQPIQAGGAVMLGQLGDVGGRRFARPCRRDMNWVGKY